VKQRLKLLAILAIALIVPAAVSAAIVLTAKPSTPIQHIVIIVQENQTFNHFFGAFPGLLAGFGINSTECMPNVKGKPCVAPFNGDSESALVQATGLSHSWQAAHLAYNGGRMNGFVTDQPKKANASDSMSYFTGVTLPDYWDLASHFGLDANFFSSSMSYSYPNHIFLVAGQAQSACATGQCKPVLDLTFETIVTPMNALNVTWGYFAGNWKDSKDCVALTQTTGYWNVLPAFPAVQQGSTCHDIQNLPDFRNDISKGYLPQVSWVTPMTNESDHPGCGSDPNVGACSKAEAPLPSGQLYVSNIIDSIENNPTLYQSTAIFLTWDDFGGYYDPVVPDQIDAYGLGLRVPLIVMSPYVIQGIGYGPLSGGYGPTHQQDFTAILRTIEDNWGLPSFDTLTSRDSTVGDLLWMFNFGQTPIPPLILPSNVLATYPPSSCTVCSFSSSSTPYTSPHGLVLPQANDSTLCSPVDAEGDPCD